jgi:3-methyladenine DNA glycosylase Mpg
MLNISAEMPAIGAGVLIRALEPLEGIPIMRLNRGIERPRPLRAILTTPADRRVGSEPAIRI